MASRLVLAAPVALGCLAAGTARDRPKADRAVQQDACVPADSQFPVDTAAATALIGMAVRMAAIADSAYLLTARVWVQHAGEPFENELPEYSASSAEIALMAANYGPRSLPARRAAAQLSLKASSLGEAVFDSTWAHRALEHVACAVQLADSSTDPRSFAALRKLERDIRQAVDWSVPQ